MQLASDRPVARCIDPCVDLVRIEAQQVAPLHERDPPFVDEATHVPDLYAETRGDFVDVDERPAVRVPGDVAVGEIDHGCCVLSRGGCQLSSS